MSAAFFAFKKMTLKRHVSVIIWGEIFTKRIFNSS